MNMMGHMTNDALLFDIRYNGNVFFSDFCRYFGFALACHRIPVNSMNLFFFFASRSIMTALCGVCAACEDGSHHNVAAKESNKDVCQRREM